MPVAFKIGNVTPSTLRASNYSPILSAIREKGRKTAMLGELASEMGESYAKVVPRVDCAPAYGVELLSQADIFHAEPIGRVVKRDRISFADNIEIAENDILLAGAGQIGDTTLFGRAVLADRRLVGKLAAGDNFIIRFSKSNSAMAMYVSAFLRTELGLRAIRACSYGTSIPRLRPDLLASLPIPLASDRVQRDVSESLKVTIEQRSIFASELKLAREALHATQEIREASEMCKERRARCIAWSGALNSLDAWNYASAGAALPYLKAKWRMTLNDVVGEDGIFRGPRFARVPCAQGLDYFDSASSLLETGYLLDFAPEFLQEDRQRLLLTTRSTVELQGMVQPALERFGLVYVENDEHTVLESLRSLSGRLALRLLASTSQSAEVMGLLLAQWALVEANAFTDRLVIPLDAHRRWFVAQDDGDVLGIVRSQQRADLLVVGLHPKLRRIECHIIEVKLREEPNDAQRIDLYEKMRSQSENTKAVLRRLFDQNLYPVARADRELRAKELATVLGFYARRSHRYGLLRDDALAAALDFIQDLDGGYSLDFHTRGIAFEQRGLGEHHDEDEPGYPVHRFGVDVAGELLARARSRTLNARRGFEPDVEAPTPPEPPPRSKAFDSLRDALGATSLLAQPAGNLVIGANTAVGGKATGTPREYDGEEEPKLSVASGATVAVPGTGSLGSTTQTGTNEPTGGMLGGSATNDTTVVAAITSRHERTSTPELRGPDVLVDVLLGASEPTAQYGVIGKTLAGEVVGVDLLGCNTISLFGVQGFGKSYTLGVIAEMATTRVPYINVLPAPLASVVFHYHKSDAYEPEYASAIRPNHKQREVERLLAEYGASPRGLADVVLLTPDARVDERKREFPELEVQAIKFGSGEIGADGWKFLLGAVGNDSLYVRQIVAIMRRYRGGLTVSALRSELLQNLQGQSQQRALDRLLLAEPYIDDSASLGSALRPGRTVIVDLRDEWIEKDEALGLFVVMMKMFSTSRYEGREFSKLMVFDEAHKYITESDLIGQVVETIREMRHQATSIVIASQDPLSVPRAVIELTSILVLHRMTSPQWLKHLKSAISALDGIDDANVASLKAGEALVWAQRCTKPVFTLRPQKVVIRPRFTQYGGGTKTAVAGKTVR